MPSYQAMTIKRMMHRINEGNVYLPALQRKFVWSSQQIEKLFDSILRDYPIGTFLFWEVADAKRNDYVFYKFIQEYNELNNWKNELAPTPILPEQILGVLDGQQRLNSMFVALQGSYAFRKKHARKGNPDSYPKRHFYLNVFHAKAESDEDESQYEFRFLTGTEAKECSANHCWVKVKELMECEEADDVLDLWDSYADSLSEEIEVEKDKLKGARNVLNRLWNRLTNEEVINYYPVENQNLDEILDIFVRVNSAGKTLTKTDLLFSTIVAHWEDGRSQIEDFLEKLNSKGDGFSFDNDFMMKTCLVLTERPSKLRVQSFCQKNVQKIIASWEDITKALESTVDLLVGWGVCGETLTATNAAIPLAYASLKGCDFSKSNADLRLFLIKSLLAGIYGAHGDQLLSDLRAYFSKNLATNSRFSLSDFETNGKLPPGKSIRISNEQLDELMRSEKGPKTFMLLSLIYPNMRFSQIKFHQDHIHPFSSFRKANLMKCGVPENDIENFQELRNCLSNLQLLEGSENQSKSDSSLVDWVDKQFSTPEEKRTFLKENLISEDVSLELRDFKTFFESREKTLKEKITKFLGVRSQ